MVRRSRLLAILAVALTFAVYACSSDESPTAPSLDGTRIQSAEAQLQSGLTDDELEVNGEENSTGGDVAAQQRKGGQSKMDICHVTGQGGFVDLSVSSNAAPAHFAHGDLPGASAWAGDFNQNGWEYTFSVESTACARPGEVIARVDYGIGCDPGVWVLDGVAADGTLQVTEQGLGDACYNLCRYELVFDPQSGEIAGYGLEEADCSPEDESGWTFVLRPE